MIFVPGRAMRRSVAGTRCSLCDVKMHHSDVVGAAEGDDLQFAHLDCVLRMADAPGEEDPGASAAEPVRLDATGDSVADGAVL